jgi:hypothetical protein
MQWKPIAVIVVLSLFAASLTVIITQKPSTAPTTTPTYPYKLLNYGPLFGRVSCEPGWTYGTQFLPTDGSGSYTPVDCSGNTTTVSTGASNQLAYMTNNSWGVELTPTAQMIESYPSELATLGPGHTEMDTFRNVYASYMDQHHIKWWLGIDLIMDDESVLTYQTPGYNSTHYTPASGMATSYEAEFGPAFDFIEHNCSANFQGYMFEQAYTNGVIWLHNRTKYAVVEKSWDCWRYTNADDRGVNTLMGTTANGSNILYTPLQRIGMLDGLIIEIYSGNGAMFDNWQQALPQVRAAYPNLPLILNVDQVAASEGWTGGTPPVGKPVETGTDSGWWAPQGLGEPNNRSYTEQLWALQRIYRLEEINGKPFDGIIYNFYHNAFPESGPGDPDVTWFLQFADTLYVTNPVQTPQIQVSVDGGSTQSLNFGVVNKGSSARVILQLYAGGNVANLPNATVTFNVAGTSISKTTADNTIFFRLPTPMTGSTVQNPDPPGFVIRLSPGDIAGLAAGSHPYTLVVTTSYGTETFNGKIIIFHELFAVDT